MRDSTATARRHSDHSPVQFRPFVCLHRTRTNASLSPGRRFCGLQAIENAAEMVRRQQEAEQAQKAAELEAKMKVRLLTPRESEASLATSAYRAMPYRAVRTLPTPLTSPTWGSSGIGEDSGRQDQAEGRRARGGTADDPQGDTARPPHACAALISPRTHVYAPTPSYARPVFSPLSWCATSSHAPRVSLFGQAIQESNHPRVINAAEKVADLGADVALKAKVRTRRSGRRGLSCKGYQARLQRRSSCCRGHALPALTLPRCSADRWQASAGEREGKGQRRQGEG